MHNYSKIHCRANVYFLTTFFDAPYAQVLLALPRSSVNSKGAAGALLMLAACPLNMLLLVLTVYCAAVLQGQPWCFQKTGGVNPAMCKAQSPRYDCG